MGRRFAIRVMIALAGILLYGVATWILTSQKDFVTALVSGILGNVIFYFAGAIDPGLSSETSQAAVSRRFADPDAMRAGVRMTILRTAVALSLLMALSNLLGAAAQRSLDRLVQSDEAIFVGDGYRDVATHLVGYVAMPLFLVIMGYFYHLGSRFRDVRYWAIVAGCALSINAVMAFYLLQGAVRPLAVIDYFHMQVPAPLEPHGRLLLNGAAWGLTLAVDVVFTLSLAAALWISQLAGSRWGRPN